MWTRSDCGVKQWSNFWSTWILGVLVCLQVNSGRVYYQWECIQGTKERKWHRTWRTATCQVARCLSCCWTDSGENWIRFNVKPETRLQKVIVAPWFTGGVLTYPCARFPLFCQSFWGIAPVVSSCCNFMMFGPHVTMLGDGCLLKNKMPSHRPSWEQGPGYYKASTRLWLNSGSLVVKCGAKRPNLNLSPNLHVGRWLLFLLSYSHPDSTFLFSPFHKIYENGTRRRRKIQPSDTARRSDLCTGWEADPSH